MIRKLALAGIILVALLPLNAEAQCVEGKPIENRICNAVENLAGAQTGTSVTLLSNASATGSAVAWGGGTATLKCIATNWNSASAQLQVLYDGSSTWIDNGDVPALTEDGGTRGIPLEAGQYRIAITGSPTGVSCNLKRGG